ncbi:MAG: hypothetical protein H6812_10425 [Phycisphaeraceae bacterium]|nr:hypothetical protein [Phycisphaerales bacterium]MCB9843662.1 hypothetical protein [Phycisphaeraceae bacterium]
MSDLIERSETSASDCEVNEQRQVVGEGNMGGGGVMEFRIGFAVKAHGRREVREGGTGRVNPGAPVTDGRVPRLTRLMALAIRIESLLEDGAVASLAEVSALGKITRARMTQIMNLRLLAPDIQEEILYLPPIESGKDALTEKRVRPIAVTPDWRAQRRMWRELRDCQSGSGGTIPAVPPHDHRAGRNGADRRKTR